MIQATTVSPILGDVVAFYFKTHPKRIYVTIEGRFFVGVLGVENIPAGYALSERGVRVALNAGLAALGDEDALRAAAYAVRLREEEQNE